MHATESRDFAVREGCQPEKWKSWTAHALFLVQESNSVWRFPRACRPCFLLEGKASRRISATNKHTRRRTVWQWIQRTYNAGFNARFTRRAFDIHPRRKPIFDPKIIRSTCSRLHVNAIIVNDRFGCTNYSFGVASDVSSFRKHFLHLFLLNLKLKRPQFTFIRRELFNYFISSRCTVSHKAVRTQRNRGLTYY